MSDYLKPLTSLRFFAAVWVILFSYWPLLQGAAPLWIIARGYLGVDLFFILSGFILCHVYLESFGAGKFRYGQFIVNRLARIYPLHIATLLFTLALVMAAAVKGLTLDSHVASWASLPAQIFMVHAWGLAPEASWNHPSWSISAEWFAYLLFPVFASVTWGLRSRPVVAVALAAAFLTILYWAFEALAGFALTRATFMWGAMRIVPCFALGCAVYLAWRAGAVASKTIALGGVAVSLAVILGVTALMTSDALVVLALGGLILSVGGLATADGKGIMSNRVLVYLGNVSFAMYMVYVPWKWVFTKAAGMILGREESLPLMWWLGGLVAIIPIAMLAHHVVENPMRNVVRHIGDGVRYRLNYRLQGTSK